MEITYKGDHEYAGLVCTIVDRVLPDHQCYRTAPSHLWTLADGTRLHIVAYNTPKSGIVIRCWIASEREIK